MYVLLLNAHQMLINFFPLILYKNCKINMQSSLDFKTFEF